MNKIIYSVVCAFFVVACTTSKVSNTEETKTEMSQVTNGIDRSVMPTPGPAPKVNLGKPQTFELANGLKVLVVENNKLPRVTMNLTLDNPPVAEGNKKGVKDLVGSLLGNGTSKVSKDEFNEQLDFYGANVGFSADGAYASTLSKYFPEVLSLVSQGLLDPVFTEGEFKKEKDKYLEGLKADEKNVSSVASNVRDAFTFGKNHPFGEFVNDKTLPNVTLKDVNDFYKKNFVPSDAYLVVVGDVKFDDVKNLVTKDFSSWKGATVNKGNFSEPVNLSHAEIDFVDMPNAVQSEIATMNITNLKLTDKDYFAALMANQILGGGGEGRLFLNLREAHGWTYGSYSRLSADKEVGRFISTASVRNAVTDSAIVEIINELGKIRTDLVSAEELKNAKAKYIGNFVMQAEKPEVIARQALQTQTQGLPADFYENYIANINAVTPEQVRSAAQKYFSKDNTRIVVVGKQEEVLAGLKGLNVPIKYFDRYGEPVAEPKAQAAVDASVTGEAIIDKFLKASGGKEKLKAVKTLKTLFTMTGAAPIPLDGEKLELAPNKEKMIFKMNGNVAVTQSFDGTTMRTTGMMGNSEQTGEEVASQAAKKGIFAQAFYDKADLGAVTSAKVDGVDAYKIKVTQNGESIEEFYDTKTGLLLQTISVASTPQGDMQTITKYSDYKDVDGILLPFNMVVESGPQVMNFVISSYDFKAPIAATDF